MTISGIALAISPLLGSRLGDLLGGLLGAKANVGGVGIAMLLLIASRHWLVRRGRFSHGLRLGVEFWGSIYIPIPSRWLPNRMLSPQLSSIWQFVEFREAKRCRS
jgi:malonate transporter MadL subunit